MSLFDNTTHLEYNNHQYTIIDIDHNGTHIPVLIDREFYKPIKNLKKKWYINSENNMVYCLLKTRDDAIKQVYLHDLIIKLNKANPYNHNVSHINRINFDNRLCNLLVDTTENEISKSLIKKKRTVELDDLEVDVDKIPTYVVYAKPNEYHNGRFVINIPGELIWYTTSSKDVSINYKLEEAKKYLRYLNRTRPDIFMEKSMNGDLTSFGKTMLHDYSKLIQYAGYSFDDRINIMETNTPKYISENLENLSKKERILLKIFDPAKGRTKYEDNIKLCEKVINELKNKK